MVALQTLPHSQQDHRSKKGKLSPTHESEVERSHPSWSFRGLKAMGENVEGSVKSFTFKKRKRDKPAEKEPSEKPLPEYAVNLRDVGLAAGGNLRAGMLFRSSQLLSKADMSSYGIKTILDLRRLDRPCRTRKDTKLIVKLKSAAQYVVKGRAMVVPETALPMELRGWPKNCNVCGARFEQRYELPMNIMHADLIPGMVGFRIFQAMPKRVRLRAAMAGICGKGAASVMAPAVANPGLMGYKALYKTLLEDSKRGLARAMRVFADPDNFPILVHCIHGKDRTGIVIALLLMLCDVSAEAIVDDYMRSEVVLKESRMHDELDLDVYLTSDEVIAATRDTMEETIQFIKDKYGSADKYLHSAGIEEGELAHMRLNLMQHARPTDLLSRMSSFPSRGTGIHNAFGLIKRSSMRPRQSGMADPLRPSRQTMPAGDLHAHLRRTSSVERPSHQQAGPTSERDPSPTRGQFSSGWIPRVSTISSRSSQPSQPSDRENSSGANPGPPQFRRRSVSVNDADMHGYHAPGLTPSTSLNRNSAIPRWMLALGRASSGPSGSVPDSGSKAEHATADGAPMEGITTRDSAPERRRTSEFERRSTSLQKRRSVSIAEEPSSPPKLSGLTRFESLDFDKIQLDEGKRELLVYR
ncbi:hypothetical protein WJX73_008106 [Symbiochloris irregularis]|uniref:Tyrosine specific protein phosphatases domain-containing protein n=1 Tax=Symbiochloris irregularis TaxID=706552 RepID=A0AAW1NLY7_9CHLO